MPDGDAHAAAVPCFSHDRVPQQTNILGVGGWVPRVREHPYRMDTKFWHELGLNAIRDNPNHPHAYGRCDALSNRTLYDWVPASCTLDALQDADDTACGPQLGRQVLFVGDSTIAQLFLSFVLSIGGAFGRDSHNTGTIHSLTAAACGGQVRLSFERADALLWDGVVRTANGASAHAFTCACLNGMMVHRAFIERARTADVVVLGVGQHYAALVEDTALQHRHLTYSFFARNLNRTLATLAAANPNASRVIVGASAPIPGCSIPGRFTAPARAAAVLMHESDAVPSNRYAVSWGHNARLNTLAREVALEVGASYIDLTTLSASRADDALGRFSRATFEDCVHYCMPGVVDEFARLVQSALAARTDGPPSRRDEWRSVIDNATWLGMRGAGSHLETYLSRRRNHSGDELLRNAQWAKLFVGPMNESECDAMCQNGVKG